MNNILLLIITTILTLSLQGCASKNDHDQLRERINQYYSFEKNKDWNNTYKYRTKKFREAIKFENYAAEMEKGSKGWSLEKVEIKKIVDDNNKAKVVLIFKEIPPKEYFKQFNIPDEKITKTSTVTNKGWGIWVYENNDWYSLDAVSRGHLFMNSQQVW